jgi:hypothetical protein
MYTLVVWAEVKKSSRGEATSVLPPADVRMSGIPLPSGSGLLLPDCPGSPAPNAAPDSHLKKREFWHCTPS